MKVIATSGQKGGCGKTTVAFHLAHYFIAQGKSVGLVDLDPQATATKVAGLRDSDRPHLPVVPATTATLAATLAEAEADGVDFIVVDCPPHATAGLAGALRRADLLLLPFSPTTPDLLTASTVAALVAEVGRPALAVLSRVKTRSASAADARRHLEGVGLHVAEAYISDLNDFATALSDGLAVGEFAPKGKAAREIRALGKEVETLLISS